MLHYIKQSVLWCYLTTNNTMEIITWNFSLKHLIDNHFLDFSQNSPYKIRDHIFDVFSYTRLCWTWGLWFATFECPCCHKQKVTNFTCWSRFCFSCSKPKSDKRISHLLSWLPQNIDYYHIFFTIPEEFRRFFRLQS